MEEYQKAQQYFDNAVFLRERLGFGPSQMNIPKIASCKANVMHGNPDLDLEKLYNYADENKLRISDGRVARDLGEILLNIDDQHISEAEDWIKKAIETDERYGMMWQLGRDYALYAEMFKRKGDQPKAKENLNKAIEILKECEADGWVKKYEKELAALS